MPNFNGTGTGNDMQCINQNSDGSYEGRDCNGKGTNTAIFSVALQLTVRQHPDANRCTDVHCCIFIKKIHVVCTYVFQQEGQCHISS